MPSDDAGDAAGQRPERELQSGEVERERRAFGRAAEEIARETADHGHQRADRKIEPGREHRHGLRHRDHGEREDLVGVLHEAPPRRSPCGCAR